MQIKHSLKRHIIGACILGAVALLALATGSGNPPTGQAAAKPPGAGGTTAAAALDGLAAMTLATSGASAPAVAPAPAAAASMPTPTQEQAAQRTLIQTERRVATLRQQGGDENAVYHLRAAILPIAVVTDLMERERAEARWRQARQGAATLPPVMPALKQE